MTALRYPEYLLPIEAKSLIGEDTNPFLERNVKRRRHESEVEGLNPGADNGMER